MPATALSPQAIGPSGDQRFHLPNVTSVEVARTAFLRRGDIRPVTLRFLMLLLDWAKDTKWTEFWMSVPEMARHVPSPTDSSRTVSDRTIQRYLAELKAKKILVPVGQSGYGTNIYRICVSHDERMKGRVPFQKLRKNEKWKERRHYRAAWPPKTRRGTVHVRPEPAPKTEEARKLTDQERALQAETARQWEKAVGIVRELPPGSIAPLLPFPGNLKAAVEKDCVGRVIDLEESKVERILKRLPRALSKACELKRRGDNIDTQHSGSSSDLLTFMDTTSNKEHKHRAAKRGPQGTGGQRAPRVPPKLLEMLKEKGVDPVAARRVLGALLRDKVDKETGEVLREAISVDSLTGLVARQLTWLPYRTGVVNQAAYLVKAIQMDYSMPARMEQALAEEQLEAARLMVRALEAMRDAADEDQVLAWRPLTGISPLPVLGFDDRGTAEGPVAIIEFPGAKTERLPIKKFLKTEHWVYMADPHGMFRPRRR